MTAATSTGAVAAPRNNLGNRAKSIHKPREAARGADVAKSKTARYALQRAAGKLLFDGTGQKNQKFRVTHCCRSMKGDGVDVRRNVDGSGAHYAGLTTCGSGWTCPVCAAKIAEVRRAELSRALVDHVEAGGRAHLITLTFPHERDWDLADMLARFDKARQGWKNSRSYQRILGKDEAAGCIGIATSLEITKGLNGWHPHVHMLAFTRRSLTSEEAQELTDGFRPGKREKKISGWIGQLIRVGLADHGQINDMRAHALDIRGGEDAAAYIAGYKREADDKWNLSKELTLSHAKTSAHESRTPFGLLADYINPEIDPSIAAAAGRDFVTFAHAFLGKRLLTFSPGMRKHFGMGDDREDEEIAAAAERVADEKVARIDPQQWKNEKVARIDPQQWKTVLEHDARAELLHMAATYCTTPEDSQEFINDYIESLKERKKKGGSWFWTPMQRRWTH